MTANQINSFKHFMHDQEDEISKHVWIESEKAGHDVRIQAGIEWVTNYAESFRKLWEEINGAVV